MGGLDDYGPLSASLDAYFAENIKPTPYEDWSEDERLIAQAGDAIRNLIAAQPCPAVSSSEGEAASQERGEAKTLLALLESARSMMRLVSDDIEDEGDRAFLGSTNHADWLRAEAERIEAYFILNGVDPEPATLSPGVSPERISGADLFERLRKVAYATEFLDVREDILALIEIARAGGSPDRPRR